MQADSLAFVVDIQRMRALVVPLIVSNLLIGLPWSQSPSPLICFESASACTQLLAKTTCFVQEPAPFPKFSNENIITWQGAFISIFDLKLALTKTPNSDSDSKWSQVKLLVWILATLKSKRLMSSAGKLALEASQIESEFSCSCGSIFNWRFYIDTPN